VVINGERFFSGEKISNLFFFFFVDLSTNKSRAYPSIENRGGLLKIGFFNGRNRRADSAHFSLPVLRKRGKKKLKNFTQQTKKVKHTRTKYYKHDNS
jgi:hypothetical protein